jgi:hypothetical protein
MKKRSEVTLEEKFRYIGMALMEMGNRPETKWRTDAIGIACQYSVAPKLKREDFDCILSMQVSEIIEMVRRHYLHVKK